MRNSYIQERESTNVAINQIKTALGKIKGYYTKLLLSVNANIDYLTNIVVQGRKIIAVLDMNEFNELSTSEGFLKQPMVQTFSTLHDSMQSAVQIIAEKTLEGLNNQKKIVIEKISTLETFTEDCITKLTTMYDKYFQNAEKFLSLRENSSQQDNATLSTLNSTLNFSTHENYSKLHKKIIEQEVLTLGNLASFGKFYLAWTGDELEYINYAIEMINKFFPIVDSNKKKHESDVLDSNNNDNNENDNETNCNSYNDNSFYITSNNNNDNTNINFGNNDNIDNNLHIGNCNTYSSGNLNCSNCTSCFNISNLSSTGITENENEGIFSDAGIKLQESQIMAAFFKLKTFSGAPRTPNLEMVPREWKENSGKFFARVWANYTPTLSSDGKKKDGDSFDEVSLCKKELVQVIKTHMNSHWLVEKRDGTIGYAPCAILEPVD